MLEISYPFVFLLLLLPFVAMFIPYRAEQGALYFPNIVQIKRAQGDTQLLQSTKESLFAKFLLFMVYALVVLALSKPLLIQKPVVEEEALRDILVAVDLSASMSAKDFTSQSGENIDRLQAQKEVLQEFFRVRAGDNIGLIFYGSAAFIQSPFTSDTNASIKLLNEAQIGMAGPKTVIGDAIGLAIKLFDESKIKERMMILMSDGTDTGSKVAPLEAAKLAKKRGIKIITIAVGDPDAKGNEKVDIKTLQKIAKMTDAEFYFAQDRKSLLDIYKQIDKLHPKKVKKRSYRRVKELFIYPLMAAFSLLLLSLLSVLLFKRSRNV